VALFPHPDAAMVASRRSRTLFPHAQRYLIAGVLALIPLWVTWIVFNFLVDQLSALGRPWVHALAAGADRVAPGIADILVHPWFEWALGILLMLVLIYLLGWGTTHVIGRRLIGTLEGLLDRIPLVKAIYGGTKKFVSAFQAPPQGVQRVVLVHFPSDGMKTVAFVTNTVIDRETGRELAILYVPTTPNPTSGYTEIVPVDRLTPTDWTIEEAMRFVISGGTSAPGGIAYGERAPGAVALESLKGLSGHND
jgi:uncharacterized membrane protein